MSEQSPDEKESFMQGALGNFKKALLKNPTNEQARYNYELLNIANAHSGDLGKLDFDFKNFKIWTFDAIFILKK